MTSPEEHLKTFVVTQLGKSSSPLALTEPFLPATLYAEMRGKNLDSLSWQKLLQIAAALNAGDCRSLAEGFPFETATKPPIAKRLIVAALQGLHAESAADLKIRRKQIVETDWNGNEVVVNNLKEVSEIRDQQAAEAAVRSALLADRKRAKRAAAKVMREEEQRQAVEVKKAGKAKPATKKKPTN